MANKLISIDRSRWIRGGFNLTRADSNFPITSGPHGRPISVAPGSYLLRTGDDRMCCVGQACEQLGIPKAELRDIYTVDDLMDAGLPIPEELRDPRTLDPAYAINDSNNTTDAQKELALIPVFAEMGLDIEFIN